MSDSCPPELIPSDPVVVVSEFGAEEILYFRVPKGVVAVAPPGGDVAPHLRLQALKSGFRFRAPGFGASVNRSMFCSRPEFVRWKAKWADHAVWGLPRGAIPATVQYATPPESAWVVVAHRPLTSADPDGPNQAHSEVFFSKGAGGEPCDPAPSAKDALRGVLRETVTLVLPSPQ